MTNKERFEEFKTNVQQWATDRGIYANGKASSQLLKALSELGELADGIAKGDRAAIEDGIGDVTVCLVNYAHMIGAELESPKLLRSREYTNQDLLGDLSIYLGQRLKGSHDKYLNKLNFLCTLAANNGLYFLDCCDVAWNEIKDRKGFLNDNGVFVKE